MYSFKNVKQFILVLLFINYCISFHTNNYKPNFASPGVIDYREVCISLHYDRDTFLLTIKKVINSILKGE